MAPSSSSSSSAAAAAAAAGNPKKLELQKKIRNHEISISEMNALSSSRSVYQKNGNIFFRKDIETAKAFEQKQLDVAKAQLQKLTLLDGSNI